MQAAICDTEGATPSSRPALGVGRGSLAVMACLLAQAKAKEDSLDIQSCSNMSASTCAIQCVMYTALVTQW
jgi:hypothetical protein